ncbi:LemA family protein [Alkalilimnicola sp. S0819]|uniref:LemA family protein n=1 Tax=Alkalilimnicola sp. S0819 TaxID=2613922 RepID=UPI001261FD01|nr:LemA family protein [Alkalilimnicola sp. S0819]KAB7627803.1 hypothetical protein F3N43_02165 [Alkalilimnicola sp. S0819]MPQ15433.1 hypothetical protein [Alkalilimnicola sp. S0819]
MLRAAVLSLLWLFLAAVSALLGAWALQQGFDTLKVFRQMELIPRAELAAALPGELNGAGYARVYRRTLNAPDTGTRSLYYRYTVERRERDAEGNTRWVTVRDQQQAVPFTLEDGTGEIRVQPGNLRADLAADHETIRGNRRYREYRIEPGDRVHVLGYARVATDGSLELGFTAPGSYQPTLSDRTETETRRRHAFHSLLLMLAGMSGLSLAAMLLCFALRVHQTALLLGVTASVLITLIVSLGLRTARQDAQDALAYQQRLDAVGEQLVGQLFQQHNLYWNGDWQALADEQPRQAALPEYDRYRVDRMRLYLHRASLRSQQLAERWPEAWFLPAELPEPRPLHPRERSELQRLEAQFQPTRLAHWQGLLLGLGGLLGAALLGGWGFRHVRLKRLIENLPFTPLQGVSYGLTEVQGTVRAPDGEQALAGPLTGRPCVSYEYRVQERRGSGKNQRWVTIEKRAQRMPFMLTDRDERLRVDPDGAEIISRHRDKRRQGRLRYFETRLEPGDWLYALGNARLSEADDALELAEGEADSPYLLSNYSEREVMLRKARLGFLLLVLGMSGGASLALGLAGGLGAFGALPWLLCAAVPLLYAVLVLAALMYNDLIFLRQRIRATWGNIEVALRKRFDLIPNLQAAVRGYMDHERGLQTQLVKLRGQLDQAHFSEAESEAVLSTEHAVKRHLMALVERYPELKADEGLRRLMRSLSRLEQEVAAMRAGYFNAQERYDTRRTQFPEVLIARLFRFGNLEAGRV